MNYKGEKWTTEGGGGISTTEGGELQRKEIQTKENGLGERKNLLVEMNYRGR